jgi:Lon protease-like protein
MSAAGASPQISTDGTRIDGVVRIGDWVGIGDGRLSVGVRLSCRLRLRHTRFMTGPTSDGAGRRA